MTPAAIGLTLGAVSLACLGVMFWIAAKAPLGWEDEDGFHEGIEPLADEQAWGDQ
jgi:hypothetical protein